MADLKLTHSSMSCAKTCLRMYYYKYILGLVKQRIGTPMYVGSLFHDGLELGAAPPKPEPPEWLGLDGDYEGDRYKWECDYQLACAMVNAYHEYWADRSIEIVEREWEFTMPIANPDTSGRSRTFDAAGKIDKIVELPDGRMAIMEHKTTTQDLAPDGAYWRKLTIDQQISHYWLGASHGGFDIKTILYDVTRRPMLKPRSIPVLDEEGNKIVVDADGERVYNKNGSPRQSAGDGMTLQTRAESPQEFGLRVFEEMSGNPDRYFCCREIPRLENDMEVYKQELWQQSRMIGDCQTNGYFFMNTGACFKWNRPCEYFDVCTSGIFKEGDDAPIGFEFNRIHAELSEEGGDE